MRNNSDPLSDKEIRAYFKNTFGFRVRNVDPYRIALTHKSASEANSVCGKLNNERLEYFGDAILGAITADFLFHKYPLETEGGLTRLRSKLVSRAHLNVLGKKLGLRDMVRIATHQEPQAVNGNTFEAVVGAIYLDQGFKKTYKIIINNIFLTHLDLDALYEADDDYKSQLMIWVQRNHHHITFENSREQDEHGHLYRSTILIDGEEVAFGLGYSVKSADQSASEKALAKLAE